MPFPILALLAYVRRAHEIQIRPSSLVLPIRVIVQQNRVKFGTWGEGVLAKTYG